MNISANSQAFEHCFKSTQRFTKEIITNICDGSVHAVPYGFWDYLFYIIVVGLGIAATGIFLAVIINAIRN